MSYEDFKEIYLSFGQQVGGDQQAARSESARLEAEAENVGGAEWQYYSLSALIFQLYADFGSNVEAAWLEFQSPPTAPFSFPIEEETNK